MTETAHSLYAEIDELAAAVDSLSPRGKAVIFGVCGRALAPLLRQAEQRSEGRFTVPDLDVALDLIQAFATGSAEAADYSELRARLDRAASEDEHPWSTYVQDVLICERRLSGLVRIPRAGQRSGRSPPRRVRYHGPRSSEVTQKVRAGSFEYANPD